MTRAKRPSELRANLFVVVGGITFIECVFKIVLSNFEILKKEIIINNQMSKSR